MLPAIHFMTSTIMAASLYPVFGWNVLFVIAAGYFLDADHYLLFLLKEKNFNLRKAYSYFRDKKNCVMILKNDVLVFHTIEVLIILTILSLYSEIFLLMAFGVALHIILDWADDATNYRNIKMPSLFLWLFSQIL